MSWIKTIGYDEADNNLKRLYDKVSGPNTNIDNVLLVHSLRPHTLKGHMTLYKSVLHHSSNTLPKWYLETIGTYTSQLNGCSYCVSHHFAGLTKLLNNEKKAANIFKAIQNDDFKGVLNHHYIQGLIYAKKITLDIKGVQEQDIIDLRSAGYDDGEILEINQNVSYFNYVNRSVLGLGCKYGW